MFFLSSKVLVKRLHLALTVGVGISLCCLSPRAEAAYPIVDSNNDIQALNLFTNGGSDLDLANPLNWTSS